MKQSLLANLVQFIIKPRPLAKTTAIQEDGAIPIKSAEKQNKFLKNAWGTIRVTGLQFIIAISLGVVVTVVLSLFQLEDTPSAFDQFLSREMILILVFSAVIIAPITEELVFRTPLRFSALNFGIFFGTQIYFWQNMIMSLTVENADPNTVYYFGFELPANLFSTLLLGPLSMIVLSLIFFTIFKILFSFKEVNTSAKRKYHKIFPLVLYLTAILFGTVHIFNYLDYKQLLWLAPILVAPQLTLGLTLGFIRTKYGLFWAMLSHALHNAAATLPLALVMLGTESFTQMTKMDPSELTPEFYETIPPTDYIFYGLAILFFLFVLIICVILIIQMIVELIQSKSK